MSGQRTCFAEATRHGSAYLGELKILREYSFVADMTMKLNGAQSAMDELATASPDSHMLNTLTADSAPEFHCFM